MMNGLLYFCELVLVLSLIIGLIRFVKGPATLDRILAFDYISICVVGFVIVFSIQMNTPFYVEVLIIFCLLGFTTTLAFMDSLFRENGESD